MEAQTVDKGIDETYRILLGNGVVKSLWEESLLGV
jgi:hypothetical protein